MNMRPMKLAGDFIIFGENSLDYLETIEGKKAFIVMSGDIIEKTGYLKIIVDYLKKAGIESKTFTEVEPDPTFSSVKKGSEQMMEFQPDWIIGVGGGSAMDAAKAMWIFYEHPEYKTLEDIAPPNLIGKLRKKAKMICIPTSSGTGSEVSRSIVITDDETHIKYGIGDMEMMPDVAILEPGITASMPANFTAATGMDALTHAVEAYTSKRANEISDVLSEKAILEIIKYLPLAYKDGENLKYREKMLIYSMISGLSFTNVSLGIVHSLSHAIGGKFGVPHGLSNAIILPYIIKYNMDNEEAKSKYHHLAKLLDTNSFLDQILALNRELNIPKTLKEVIKDDSAYESAIEELANLAEKDGCSKTNPIIPTSEEYKKLTKLVYYGEE